MAKRRMFSLDVVDTDNFLDMPATTQLLYYHLGMRADDDGFVSSPKRITNYVGCNDDDLKLLIAKGFVIAFDNGVIVIKDWKINNWVRPDRKQVTRFKEELESLTVSDDKYVLSDIIPNDNQTTTKRHTEFRLGKVRLGKDRLDKESKVQRFTPPTLEEVKTYCEERNNGIDPQRFIDFYDSKGWMVGKNKMKDWKAAIRTWENRNKPIATSQEEKKPFDNGYHGFEYKAPPGYKPGPDDPFQ